MVTLGIWIFLASGLIFLTWAILKERKAEKRIWDWRERLLESINRNADCTDKIVDILCMKK